MKTDRTLVWRDRTNDIYTPVCDMGANELLSLINRMRVALITQKMNSGHLLTGKLTFDYLVAEAIDRGFISAQSSLITGIEETPKHERSSVGTSNPPTDQGAHSVAPNPRRRRPSKRPLVPRSKG